MSDVSDRLDTIDDLLAEQAKHIEYLRGREGYISHQTLENQNLLKALLIHSRITTENINTLSDTVSKYIAGQGGNQQN